MRSIVTDRVAWSVGLSVTVVSPAKTAEPIEMQFGMLRRVDPRNHVLDGGADAQMEEGTLLGERLVQCKHGILGTG